MLESVSLKESENGHFRSIVEAAKLVLGIGVHGGPTRLGGTVYFSPEEMKLRELVLYVAAKCDSDPDFGAVKLNKILFFSDFAAYASRGRAITGVQYRRYVRGPAPACMARLKTDMEKTEDAYEYQNPLPGGFKQKRLLARRSPQMDLFTPDEITIVDETIQKLRGLNGRDVSELSHQFLGWMLAEDGEEIPYYTVFIPDPQLTDLSDEERSWLQAAPKKNQLAAA